LVGTERRLDTIHPVVSNARHIRWQLFRARTVDPCKQYSRIRNNNKEKEKERKGKKGGSNENRHEYHLTDRTRLSREEREKRSGP
jgi:hypothetical protein